MRKFWAALAVGVASTCAGWAEPQCPSLTFNTGAGWRQDNFNFSIAGPGNDPNVLSEVQWKSLRMYAVNGAARYVSTHHYVIQISGECAKIYHGANRDSDYLFDHKEGEFSRIHSDAGRGHVYDLNAAVGYQVMSTGRRALVTILAGYSYDQQYLKMYDGHQRIGLLMPEGSFPGLDSSYTARWYGPWIGIDTSTRVECNAELYASFSWHMPQFRAHGDWNLRDDLIDGFEQSANAFGYDAMVGFSWDWTERWGVGIVGKYKLLHAKSGSDRIKILLDDELIKVHTKLNSARWESIGVYLTLYGRF